jgi:hypothetical protein
LEWHASRAFTAIDPAAGTGKSYRSPIDVVRFLITGEQTGEA